MAIIQTRFNNDLPVSQKKRKIYRHGPADIPDFLTVFNAMLV